MKFDRNDFFNLRATIEVINLKKILSTNFIDENINNNFTIKDISSKDFSIKFSVMFLINIDNVSTYDKDILYLVDKYEHYKKINSNNCILVKNLNKSYVVISNFLFSHEDSKYYFDDFEYINGSYISKFSKIDKTSKIGKNCLISKGTKIGKNSLIKDNVTIKNSIIGDNVIIGDNSTIGSTGFGFDLSMPGSNNLLPQLGIVIIEDNVRVGSNCTIDRAKIDYTKIGKNSMIDNMVHIAHNVKIGESACIAAQTGISGSTKIGNNFICGGQTGIAGHLKIGDNVILAAKSGVTKNVSSNSKLAGFPAIDIKKWKKLIINQKKKWI